MTTEERLQKLEKDLARAKLVANIERKQAEPNSATTMQDTEEM